ncbi:MAG: DUF1320 domain-containing protein [Desulfovibrio sp.]|nr:DUF1320 domain-containing protein [Desulfovibrio sp.]
MYASYDDVLARYGQELYVLAGRTEEGEIDEAPVRRALEEAASEIDVTLSARYAVPFVPAPAVLRRICVDLAVAALPRNGSSEASLYERRGREARALLPAIGEGTVSLDAEADPAPAQKAGCGIAASFRPSDFRRKLEEL